MLSGAWLGPGEGEKKSPCASRHSSKASGGAPEEHVPRLKRAFDRALRMQQGNTAQDIESAKEKSVQQAQKWHLLAGDC